MAAKWTVGDSVRRTDNGEPCLAFGKHDGQPLSEVPTGYLRWLVEQPGNSHGLRRLLREELACRASGQRARRITVVAAVPSPSVAHLELSTEEMYRFNLATIDQVLLIPESQQDVSKLLAVWEQWCQRHGIEPKVQRFQRG